MARSLVRPTSSEPKYGTWENTSSLSQRDTVRRSQIWSLRLKGGASLRLVFGHLYHPGKWVAVLNPLDSHDFPYQFPLELKETDLKAAQDAALDYARARLVALVAEVENAQNRVNKQGG
jgi:hypothetical protein